MVRAFQKGDSTQAPSSEVARVASSIKMKDAKKFASTKHKGLPEKKVKKESVEHVGNSDFRSSAEFMNTFAKLKRLRKKNDKIGTGNTGLPQGVAQTNRRGKMQGVEEAAIGTAAGGGAVTGSTSYTGPNKADRKVIKKMDNKKFAARLADYEKNMDPKKREALKDKATKGMKFTHEGTSYGLYKGDGKPKMQFAAFVKKVKPPETKKKSVKKEEVEQIAELDTTTLHSYVTKASSDAVKTGVDAGIAGMAGKDKKRDKKLDKAYKRSRGINRAATKLAMRAIKKEEVEQIDELSKTTTANYLYRARFDKDYVHGGKMSTKDHEKARNKGIKRAEKKLGKKASDRLRYVAKYDSDAMRQDSNKSEYPRKIKVKEEPEVYWSSKALDQLDQLNERQKDSDNQRLSQERGRSNYGKASIRNVRHTGEGGNAADPAERLVAMDKRHKAHKEKRGVKTLSKYKKVVKEEGYDHYRDNILMKGGDHRSKETKNRVNTPGQPMKGKTAAQKAAKGKTALELVKANIRQKYGKGAIMGEALNPKLQAVQDKAKANVAKQAAKAAADKKARADSAAKFQAHKKSEMAKGKRPDQALDSWQQKKLKKEDVMSFSDFLKEGNDRARMMSKAKNQTTGSIAADRGTDEKKNRESRKSLEKDLKKKGIGYKKSVGSYKYDDGSTGREVSYQTSPGKGMSKRRFGKLTRRLGRKHGQESVITKKAGKPARLHDTESKKPGKSYNLGKEVKKGKNPSGEGETSATKVRGGKLPKKTKPNSTYHYGKKK